MRRYSASKGKIEEELKERKIGTEFLDPFLEELYKTQKLPSKEIVPRTQYNRILNYLREKCVITPEDEVDESFLNIFKNMRIIESSIKFRDISYWPTPMNVYRGGGLESCYRNIGRLNPCY